MHTREISQVTFVHKYSKAANLCKARELNLTLPPSYLHQWGVLKSSVGRKSKHCPDPSEAVDKYISNEFSDKILAVKLDSITLEKEDQREIALTLQTLSASCHESQCAGLSEKQEVGLEGDLEGSLEVIYFHVICI